MSIKTPDWVKHAIFYQIYPDRFARGQRIRHPRGLQFKPWGSPPEEQGYQGGDLYGVVDHLDYLQELGVTALYLNPIFSSAANHRYHTYDYFQVDPLLGGDDALRVLLNQAHSRNMRVVLDGVFNHASRGFWAFHHILENGVTSPYIDWFHIHGWPLRPYIHDEHNPHNYDAWWGIPALPKLNFNNPGVRDYFLEVAEYWIHFGIDGWRLDVPEEINDAEFWQDFRRVVKAANPEAYIVGEIWHEAHDWLRGDRFDAVMNYALNRAAFGFFAQKTLRTDYRPGGFELRALSASDFGGAVEYMVRMHDWEIVQSQLNLLDSHDTARTLWIVNNDESALRLTVLFQMTVPGAPCIYYGSEVGMTGANDPYCRGAFPWHEPEKWNQGLLHFYKEITALRHRYRALRVGDFKSLHAKESVYAFRRNHDWQSAIVAFNVSETAVKVTIDSGGYYEEERSFRVVWPTALEQTTYEVVEGKIHHLAIPARSGVVLVAE